jgi:steroid delta-isomerase-like uncharacterized protein
MAQTKAGEPAPEQAKPDGEPQRTQVGAAARRGTGKRITRRKAVEQRVRSYFDAMDRRDVDGMLGHWAEDGVEEMVPVGILRGGDELRRSFSSMFAALPDMRTTVTRLVAGERTCAVEWRIEGSFDGEPYMGIEPTGSRVEIRGMDLIELEDDQIVSLTAYFDGAGYARQIGMLPADGSGADRAMKTAFNAMTKLRRSVAERRGAA